MVGIGGAGMAGIAEILHASGYRVTGSDLRAGRAVARLRERGVTVYVGHDAAHIEGADVLVYSSAVPRTNPERTAAEHARIPVIQRAEMLGELMRARHGIAVAGAHGKTTTTSMIGAVLQAAALDPTIVVGGRVHSLGAHSRLGAGELLVAEADESDGSFLCLLPTSVVITNIDREHLDHYGSFEALCDAFAALANRVPFFGTCVLCLDDPHVQALLPKVVRRVRTYGLSRQADVRAEGIERRGWHTAFRVVADGRELGALELAVPGLHNVQNALAAAAMGLELGVPFDAIQAGLSEFAGVARRFERRGTWRGALVIEDYAHHPTELRATLAAARQALPGRLIVAFQPHRYTRTAALFAELARAFDEADVLFVTEVYAAGESPVPGASGEALASAARAAGHRDVSYVPTIEGLPLALEPHVAPGDSVLLLGAGDIGSVADRLTAENVSQRPASKSHAGAADASVRAREGGPHDGGGRSA
jgi:UDP-N-acetylmuramate--alanine ligase